MWDIVWVSPQWHRSVSVSRHFLLQAPQCPCSVRKRFSRDHCSRRRSKPGCRIVGTHTRWELTTWADFQLWLHRLLMTFDLPMKTCDDLKLASVTQDLAIVTFKTTADCQCWYVWPFSRDVWSQQHNIQIIQTSAAWTDDAISPRRHQYAYCRLCIFCMYIFL